MSLPYFSVVISTYNRAGFIGTTLDLVLVQDFAAGEYMLFLDSDDQLYRSQERAREADKVFFGA